MLKDRWISAGLCTAVIAALAGCTESDKLTLAEMERLKRDVDKQMRLVREQNEQINDKLNVIKAEMDTIKKVYIPAVQVSLDSVAARPEQVKTQMINEVENRLRTITDNVREFKTLVTEDLQTHKKSVGDSLTTRLNSFEKRISTSTEFVDYVLTQQDSVNREFAKRIDERPWYRSIIGTWDDLQRQKKNTP